MIPVAHMLLRTITHALELIGLLDDVPPCNNDRRNDGQRWKHRQQIQCQTMQMMVP